MTNHRAAWPRLLRPVMGIAVSAAFVAVTISRVDLHLMVRAWESVVPYLIAVAAVISLAEVAVRALRWVTLLRPMADTSFLTALAYLSIGHLANAILPARLGDVARAFLAGGRLRVSRVSVLGTIAVERVADAALLGLAATIGVFIGYTGLAPALGVLALVGVAVISVAALITMVLGLDTLAASRLGALVRPHAGRFAMGAASLRSPWLLVWVLTLTVTSFALAILILQTVATAVGLPLALWQSAVVVAAVTLSTAIPAGPASVGTYEFVGVTVMASMGFQAEPSLLAVVLVHVVATLVPAGIGMVAMWSMGLRRFILEAHGHQEPSGVASQNAPMLPANATDPALSVVIPAHNSGGHLEQTVDQFAARLAARGAEIIVVENGSTDDTWMRCRRLADRWSVPTVAFIHLQSEKGMGNALRAGVRASRGSSVLLTADDLPFGFDDLDHFDRLAVTGAHTPPPMLIGSKAHPESVVERSALRSILTGGFSMLRSAILGMRTHDPQGTLIVDGRLVRELARSAVEPGFLFTTELVYLAERLGLQPIEVPVRLRASHADHQSRVSAGDMASMALGLIRLRARYRGDWRHRQIDVRRASAR